MSLTHIVHTNEDSKIKCVQNIQTNDNTVPLKRCIT